MTIVYVILGVVGWLLVGYAWAMLFMHKLTNGQWAEESWVNPGVYHYTDMGVGTAITMTLFWPFAILSVIVLIAASWISGSAGFFKKLYRVR